MQNRAEKIQSLISKLEGLIYQLNDLEEYEKQALEVILQEQGYEELRGVSISLMECHVIDCIERNAMSNTTALAKKLNITKGGISKITNRLIKKDMIEAYRLPDNQKEIYYRLKPLGKKVFALHETSHEDAVEAFKKIFDEYSQAELEFASRFLADITGAIHSEIITKPDVRNH